MGKPLVLFTLSTLPSLDDGNLANDFDATLASLVKDCLARPGVKKRRQVSIVIDIDPVPNADGSCDDVEVNVQVTSKAPAKLVRPYRMRATQKGGLKYSPDSPDNPDQQALDFGEAGS